ncbi:terminase [Aquamicrobium sp.]|uniref:terminase n=1 Tax=Aquamicrobium sp. TaxID=1872579 RepID=UPI002588726B|nr:terminase [Aquamicrobium sp.]MCK9549130.1 terminase [Aquamicrobium sp.]
MSTASLDDLKAIERLIENLSPEKRRALVEIPAIKQRLARWAPNPGPQTDAYHSQADELLYGGQAGGGKTDLLIGLALNEHKRARILRRINQDVSEPADRLLEVLGHSDGFTRNPPTWRGEGNKLIEFRGCELERDKQRFKGKARDFIGYDELADFLESQYLFINTWNRSVDPSQRCRIVGATNGPTTAEGLWIIKRWAAWLDPNHPNPAKDGELRWYLTIDGQDVEVDGPGPHEIRGRMVRASSRTFIRSRLEDNPDLAETDYGDRLESLPEELRRVYREGDFTVGLKDDDWQVIPSAWIDAAQQRWTDRPPEGFAMTAMAVDVAPGGGDKRVIAARYGGWFAPLDVAREVDRDGRLTASAVVRLRRDNCPVVVDLGGGWGGDAAVALRDNGITVVTYMGLNPSSATTRDGKLRFVNKRAETIWKVREALDPGQDGGSQIILPPDNEMKADLASFRWVLKPNGIQIESKEDIKKRIGRSPDRGEAVCMCLAPGDQAVTRAVRRHSPPKVILAYQNSKRSYSKGRR